MYMTTLLLRISFSISVITSSAMRMNLLPGYASPGLTVFSCNAWIRAMSGSSAR